MKNDIVAIVEYIKRAFYLTIITECIICKRYESKY